MSSGVKAALAAAHAASPQSMSLDELSAHLANLRAVRAWVDAAEVVATRRGRELEAAGRSGSPAAINACVGGRSGREARTVSEREAVCGEIPALEAALRAGQLSAGHVDAVALASRRLDAAGQAELADLGVELVAGAAGASADAFERSVRDLTKHIAAAQSASADVDELEAQRAMSKVERWVDRATGLHITKLSLDPLRDTVLWTAVNEQLRSDRAVAGNATVPWAQMQVDAFVNAVTARRSGPGEQPRPEISVLVSWDALVGLAPVGGVHETQSGAELPISTIRRLCCDAEVFPVVLGGVGEVLDVGRSRRTASRAQRRALAAMHRTCAHPECSVSFDACRIHHVRFWSEHGGASDLDNFLPLCESHHHLVHEGGWSVSMTPDRVTTWTRPDGSTHWTGHAADRLASSVPPTDAPTQPRSNGDRPMLC